MFEEIQRMFKQLLDDQEIIGRADTIMRDAESAANEMMDTIASYADAVNGTHPMSTADIQVALQRHNNFNKSTSDMYALVAARARNASRILLASFLIFLSNFIFWMYS